jgi:hypothetical protein
MCFEDVKLENEETQITKTCVTSSCFSFYNKKRRHVDTLVCYLVLPWNNEKCCLSKTFLDFFSMSVTLTSTNLVDFVIAMMVKAVKKYFTPPCK